jgi:hypothetical protein
MRLAARVAWYFPGEVATRLCLKSDIMQLSPLEPLLGATAPQVDAGMRLCFSTSVDWQALLAFWGHS